MGTGGGRWGHPQAGVHMVLLGLAVKLALGGPILALAAWMGMENTTLTFRRFISGRKAF